MSSCPELVRSARTQALPFKEVLRRVRIGVAQATRNQQIAVGIVVIADLVINEPRASQPRSADPLEVGFWNTIKGSESAADFKAYLDSYPNGSFAALARARLQQIEGRRPDARAAAVVPPPPAPTPPRTHAAGAFDHARLPAMSGTGARSAPGRSRWAPRTCSNSRGSCSQGLDSSAFYIGRTEVRFDEWDACVAEGGCA